MLGSTKELPCAVACLPVRAKAHLDNHNVILWHHLSQGSLSPTRSKTYPSVGRRWDMTASRKPALTACSRGNKTLRSPARGIAYREPEQCEHRDQWQIKHYQRLRLSHLMRSSTKVLGLLCVMVAMAWGDEELSLIPRNVSRARAIRPTTERKAVLLPCGGLLRRDGILAEAFEAVT